MIPLVNAETAFVTGRGSPSEGRTFVLLVWAVSLLFLCGLTIADPDLWGHTLYGLRAIDAGILTERTDPFSYTAAGAEWVNHEWLTEYQFGWLWSTFGNAGLVFWRDGLLLILMLVVLREMLRPGVGTAAAILLLVLNAEALSDFVVFVRPQVATFTFFAIYLSVLSRQEWRASVSVWWLPLLMVAWVNQHGGFLAGVGVFGIYAIDRLWRNLRSDTGERCWSLPLAFGATLLATFVNPYGSELHRMLWHHLWTHQFVREWQTVLSTGPSLNLVLPFLIVVLAAAGRAEWRRTDVLVVAVVAWQAATHLRHCALLSLTTLILLPKPMTAALHGLFPLLIERWLKPSARRLRVAAVAAVCLFLTGIEVRGGLEMWKRGIGPWNIGVECRSASPGMPMSAFGWLKERRMSGRLITDYGWAQCALWHLYPQVTIAFDGRYRTVYSAVLETEFMRLQTADRDQPERLALLDDYGTNIAVVSISSGLDGYLQKRSDWQCVRRDEQSALFLKRIRQFEEVLGRSDALTAAKPVSDSSAPVVGVAPESGKSAIGDWNNTEPRWVSFPGLNDGGTPVASKTRSSVSLENVAVCAEVGQKSEDE